MAALKRLTPRLAQHRLDRNNASAIASGGAFYRDGSNAWFPFTGDSVSWRGYADTWPGQVELLIDGVSRGVFDLMATAPTSRAFSFTGLGAGPHVLHMRKYRGRTTFDAL